MKNKSILKEKLHEMEGMPVDRNFKDVLKYTVFNSSSVKLNVIDTADINGMIAFVDSKGNTRVKIEIDGISERDFRWYERTGIGHVIGTVKKAYVI